MNITDIIIIFVMSWVSTISGVALGGHLVFRASGSTRGSLFRVRPDGKEGVAVLDDGIADVEIEDELPADIMDQNERFRAIFGSNLEQKPEKEA